MTEKNGTLENVINACYDRFLETASPDLLQMCDMIADKILDSDMDKLHLLTELSNIGCAYESNAFRGGFLACVSVLQALTGKVG